MIDDLLAKLLGQAEESAVPVFSQGPLVVCARCGKASDFGPMAVTAYVRVPCPSCNIDTLLLIGTLP